MKEVTVSSHVVVGVKACSEIETCFKDGELLGSDDVDEMRCDVIYDLVIYIRKGAFHTMKLSGSVTLDSISPLTSIFKYITILK